MRFNRLARPEHSIDETSTGAAGIATDNSTLDGTIDPRVSGDGDAAGPADIPKRPKFGDYTDKSEYRRDYGRYQRWAKTASGHTTSSGTKNEPTIASFVNSGSDPINLRPNANQQRKKPSSATINGQPATIVNYKAVGATAAMCLEVLGSAFFGHDVGKYRDADERAGIESAFTDYAKSQNITDIPPSVLCLLVVGLYSAPRLASDAGKARVKQLRDLVTSKSKSRNALPIST